MFDQFLQYSSNGSNRWWIRSRSNFLSRTIHDATISRSCKMLSDKQQTVWCRVFLICDTCFNEIQQSSAVVKPGIQRNTAALFDNAYDTSLFIESFILVHCGLDNVASMKIQWISNVLISLVVTLCDHNHDSFSFICILHSFHGHQYTARFQLRILLSSTSPLKLCKSGYRQVVDHLALWLVLLCIHQLIFIFTIRPPRIVLDPCSLRFHNLSVR